MNYSLIWKTGIIVALSLLLLIPLTMLESTIEDRISYRNQARDAMPGSWANRQILIGPLLAMRYQTKSGFKRLNIESVGYEQQENVIDRTAWFSPSTLFVNANARVSLRYRGIFPLPVYTTSAKLSGTFDTLAVNEFARGIENFYKWTEAIVIVGIADTRGLKNFPQLNWNGKPFSFELSSGHSLKLSAVKSKLGDPGTALADKAEFEVALELRGMEDLQIAPVAGQNSISITSDWPHPSFTGRYPPDSHTISDAGFTAEWHQTSLSTGIGNTLEECFQGHCQTLQNNTLGVSFVEAVDIYRQSMRSAKYGILIVTMTFLAFFLIEILKPIRIHPMQYLLVGISLCLFFLVLFATGEVLSFTHSYLLAATTCISMIGYYLKHILGSMKISGQFCGGLTAVFSSLYVIIQAENYALLMGSALLTAMVAITMILTRKTDWYEIDRKLVPAKNSAKAETGTSPGANLPPR